MVAILVLDGFQTAKREVFVVSVDKGAKDVARDGDKQNAHASAFVRIFMTYILTTLLRHKILAVFCHADQSPSRCQSECRAHNRIRQ